MTSVRQMALMLAFACIVLATSPAPTQAQEESHIYTADLFTRSVNGHWGTSDSGEPYSISNKAEDFSVGDSVGRIKVPVNKRVVGMDLSAANITASVRIRTDKRPQGGSQLLFMHVRRMGGTSYIGRLRIAPDGRVFVRAGKQVEGKKSFFGPDVQVPNVTHSTDKFVFLKIQVIGTNPTILRIRSYELGKNEPSAWNIEVTDATPELQRAGNFALRVVAPRKTANRPFVFAFDDLRLTQAASTTAVPTPKSQTRPGAIYWGALVEGAAPSPQNLASNGVFTRFEQQAGKQMSILHWGAPWKMYGKYLPFQTSYFSTVRERGSIPLVDWGSFELGKGINQPDFQLRDVYNGNHDGFIREWARAAKAWGHPFFLRFNWEMNGDWQFTWSEKLNGNAPGDYIKMWRHVHDIFEREGAHNVTWVWCPNISSDSTTPLNAVYPGDNYVDWTCLDGYNKYPTWLEFNQVFAADNINWLHNSYREITKLASNKPLMIGETASLEANDGGEKKAAWIRAALLKHLPERFPKIKAIVWFSWNDRDPRKSFPISSSDAARRAFAEGIGSDYYAANDFSTLNTSPIPPLP